MAPRRKSVTSGPRKRARSPSPDAPAEPAAPAAPRFPDSRFQKRFESLEKKKFGAYRTIDWAALAEIGLDAEVRSLLDVGRWTRLFSICEPCYREPTLEVLSTIDVERRFVDFSRPGGVVFQLFGERRSYSLSEFSILLGIYDTDFTETPEYRDLLIDFPEGETPRSVWSALTGGHPYEPSLNKATGLTRDAYRYIHAVIARSFSGRVDSTGVVSRSELMFLHSMVAQRPIHLGFLAAEFLHHQGSFGRLSAIFAGPIITRLIRGMQLSERLSGLEMVGSTSPFGLTSLHAMRMIIRRGARYVLVSSAAAPTHSEQDEEEASQESESDSPSPTDAGPSSSATPGRQQRLSERLSEIQTSLLRVRAEQLEAREALHAVRLEVRESLRSFRAEVQHQFAQMMEIFTGPSSAAASPSPPQPPASPVPPTAPPPPPSQDADAPPADEPAAPFPDDAAAPPPIVESVPPPSDDAPHVEATEH